MGTWQGSGRAVAGRRCRWGFQGLMDPVGAGRADQARGHWGYWWDELGNAVYLAMASCYRMAPRTLLSPGLAAVAAVP